MTGRVYFELADAAGSRRPYAVALVSTPIAVGYLLLAAGLWLETGWSRALLRAALTFRVLLYLAPGAWQESAYGGASIWRLVIGEPALVLLALLGAWLLRFRGERSPLLHRGPDAALTRIAFADPDWITATRVSGNRGPGELRLFTGSNSTAAPIDPPSALEFQRPGRAHGQAEYSLSVPPDVREPLHVELQIVRRRGPDRYCVVRVRAAWAWPRAFRLVPVAVVPVPEAERLRLMLWTPDESGETPLCSVRAGFGAGAWNVYEIRNRSDQLCGAVVEFSP